MVFSDWRNQIFEKKNFVAWIWAQQAKIGLEIRFFAIFSSLVH